MQHCVAAQKEHWTMGCRDVSARHGRTSLKRLRSILPTGNTWTRMAAGTTGEYRSIMAMNTQPNTSTVFALRQASGLQRLVTAGVSQSLAAHSVVVVESSRLGTSNLAQSRGRSRLLLSYTTNGYID